VAERLLGGLLGAEEEAPEAEAGEGRVSAEAFAAALAADQAKHDASVARAAEAFLQEQTRLLQTQREEIAEQRRWRLSPGATSWRAKASGRRRSKSMTKP